jgi:hypothetical protein
MAQPQHIFEKTARENVEPGSERAAFEQPAAPEVTNHDHPVAAGTRRTVPGAGIVSAGADAGPVEANPDRNRGESFPGHGSGPLNAPNAVQESDPTLGAPLDVPSDTVGPEPGSSGIPETSDPNYTAASERNRVREPGKPGTRPEPKH